MNVGDIRAEYSRALDEPFNICGPAQRRRAEMAPLCCLIVDDSSNLPEMAGALLERDDISVVGVASSSAQALRLVKELRPGVTSSSSARGRESRGLMWTLVEGPPGYRCPDPPNQSA